MENSDIWKVLDRYFENPIIMCLDVSVYAIGVQEAAQKERREKETKEKEDLPKVLKALLYQTRMEGIKLQTPQNLQPEEECAEVCASQTPETGGVAGKAEQHPQRQPKRHRETGILSKKQQREEQSLGKKGALPLKCQEKTTKFYSTKTVCQRGPRAGAFPTRCKLRRIALSSGTGVVS